MVHDPGDGSSVRGQQAGITRFEVALSLGWILMSAVQYIGTLQRTQLAVGEEPSIPVLVQLDLTPVYVVLLVGTIVVATLRAVRGGRTGGTTR